MDACNELNPLCLPLWSLICSPFFVHTTSSLNNIYCNNLTINSVCTIKLSIVCTINMPQDDRKGKTANEPNQKATKKEKRTFCPLTHCDTSIFGEITQKQCALIDTKMGRKFKKRFLIYISMTQTYWLKCTAQCT